MPVIVNSKNPHPFLPSIGDVSAIDLEQAQHQDIRPLEIAIINLMADKPATERQLAQWLGHTSLQVNLTFAATDDYINGIRKGRMSQNTSPEHIKKFYNGFSDIKDQKFDGLLVTGVNALQATVQDEAIWPDVQEIFDWSTTHAFSSLFLCWGAQAALKHFHNIDSVKGERKIYGVFNHRLVSDKTGVAFGFPDDFPAPVSRWKHPDRTQVAQHPELEVVALSDETGPSIMVEGKTYNNGHDYYPHRVYVLNHPEYETDTLQREYQRDSGINPATQPPLHYFPANDPSQSPRNTWRYTAFLYANWVKAVYEATPYDLHKVPQPCR